MPLTPCAVNMSIYDHDPVKLSVIDPNPRSQLYDADRRGVLVGVGLGWHPELHSMRA